MAYIDESGFAARFSQRELDQLTAAGDRARVFADAVADATELVDSYLGAIPARTFRLPLTVPPAKIVGVTADLARFELWSARASEEVVRRRDQAIEYLKDLVAGRAVLNIEDETTDPVVESPAGRVGYRSKCRTFTDSTMAQFTGGRACRDPLAGLRGCD